MRLIAPFAAIRPAPGRAAEVAARPYDVLSKAEAAAGADGRPFSFLHVSRAEIDLAPGTDEHAEEVYAQAARAFARMRTDGVLIRDPTPRYYAWRMTQGTHVQTGVAAAGSVAAYRENRIRRHEHTRPDKELDRTRQIEAVGAHTGPVLTVHAPDPVLSRVLEDATAAAPIADATTDDGTRHQVWALATPEEIGSVSECFAAMPAIWIADGHHRSAAAARVAESRADAASGAASGGAGDGSGGAEGGGEAGGRFLLVSFPTDQVRILDYNRVVRDLAGRTEAEFLAAVAAAFGVEPVPGALRPERPGVFGMLLGARWFRLEPRRPPAAAASPVARLDVSVLNDLLLAPILGIGDPRTDPRIGFVGGGRGLDGLARQVETGEAAVAFALHPTRLQDLIAVADAGAVMPPKSTWFEPKLADGLLSLPLVE